MKALLFGAGTYGSVYLSYLKGENINIVGILDDNKELHNSEIDGIKILGGIDLLEELYKKDIADAIYCPIGNNELRVQILEKARRIGYNIPNYIHKSVIISPNVKLGNGVYILLGSCIMPYSVIDDYVMILIFSFLCGKIKAVKPC